MLTGHQIHTAALRAQARGEPLKLEVPWQALHGEELLLARTIGPPAIEFHTAPYGRSVGRFDPAQVIAWLQDHDVAPCRGPRYVIGAQCG